MKKIIFAVMTVVAIGFTSCGNKTQAQQEAPVDSVALVDSLADEAIQETISSLKGNIETGDANKLQETLEAVKVQVVKLVKENPEMAKACIIKLQEYLKENADKVKSVVGENQTVQSAIDALISVDAQDGLAGFIGEMGNEAEQAKEDAENAAKEAAQEQVDEAKAAAQKKVDETKEEAKKKAGEAIDNVAKDAKKSLGL
jgi:hypothetical protein